MSISIYQLKSRFQDLLRPTTQWLYNKGITANQVTVVAGLGSIVLGASLTIWMSPLLFAFVPVWMFIRMALNAIDGMLAREFNQQSKLGAYLNELADVISDTALYLPFALLGGLANELTAPLVILVTVLSIISEYTGVLGIMVGAERRYDGPMGKSDRAFIFGALALLVSLGWLSLVWFNGILIIMILLLAYTTFNRIRSGLKQSDVLK